MGITAFPFSSVIDVPTARILGRDDAGTGSAEALTNTEIFAILGTGTPSASTYLRGDGTWSAVSTGISSLNGLTDATQTFAVGTSGTNVAFSSAAGVHTLNIPDASLSARGAITTGSQNIQGVKSFYAGIDAAYVNLFSWWGMGDGANGGVQFFAGHGIAWGSAANGAPVRNSLSGDVQLRRDAAGRLGQRSGTRAQASGLYNTYTSDTSFERLDLSWASNVCYIGTEKGSAGGTARDLTFGTDGAVRLVLPAAATSGALYLGPRADNTATGGNARGANSVDLSTLRSNANQVASGSFAVNIGVRNTASSQGSISIGDGNTNSSAECGIAMGYQNNCTSQYWGIAIGGRNNVSSSGYNTAIGNGCAASASYTGLSDLTGSATAIGENCTATRPSTLATGTRSVANRWGQRSHATSRFAADGDCQLGEMVLRGTTTTNSAVRLRPDGSTQRLTIASGQICQYLLIVTGVRNGGADVASYMRQVTIKNIGGTTSLVGTVNTIGVDNAAGTSLSVTADDTNDDLAIEPTGVSGQTWRWECVVYGGEIGHG